MDVQTVEVFLGPDAAEHRAASEELEHHAADVGGEPVEEVLPEDEVHVPEDAGGFEGQRRGEERVEARRGELEDGVVVGLEARVQLLDQLADALDVRVDLVSGDYQHEPGGAGPDALVVEDFELRREDRVRAAGACVESVRGDDEPLGAGVVGEAG